MEDVKWLRPDGQEMDDEDWSTHFVRSFGMMLGGDAMMEWDEEGRRVSDDTFLLLFNAAENEVPFTLPATPTEARWETVLDTARSAAEQAAESYDTGASVQLTGRSLVVLRRVPDETGEG